MRNDYKKHRKLIFILFYLLLGASNISWGQINVPNTTPVTENFNSMGTSTTLPTNWRIRPTTPTTWATGATSVTQEANSGSPTAGGTYNWGNTAGTDRAVGAMTSGAFSSPNSLLAFYRNTNASNITSLAISYNAERYRVNSAAASIQFFYSLDGTTWTAVAAGDVATASFPTGSSAYNFTPGLSIAVSFSIPSLSIANNADFYLRWNINTTGTNSQGIGIDDVSVTATFAVAGTSDIITNGSFTTPNNIAYASFQATDITFANSIEVAQFIIRDGGASAPDANTTPTTLTDITFSLTNFSNIRRVALYDGSSEVLEVAGNSTVTFVGISLVAPDNGTKTFSIRVTFTSATITDNQQFQFTVTAATANAAGTTFAAANAGGATSSITGDNNRIEVTADRLAFVTQPSNTAISAAMTSPTVSANDGLGNRDLDFTGTISITSTGTLDVTPKTATAVAGLATFTTIIHTVAATARTLTATTSGLTNAVSNNFDILNQTTFKPGDLVFVGFDANTGGGSDEVYFMTMVSILPGTTFSYVNSRFEAGAAACTRTLRWGGPGDNPDVNPGILQFTYNGSTNITAGSVIRFATTGFSVTSININGGANVLADFTVTNPGTGSANITTATGDGDQMWLVQGTFTGLGGTNVQLTGKVLYGMSMGVGWIPFSTACSGVNGGGATRQSRLHPDIECFNFVNGSALEFAFYNTTALHIGSKRQLLQSIATLGNWTTSTSAGTVPTPRSTTTFTINPANHEGTWVGDNSTDFNDWFTCGNWEGLAVPDRNIDVVIPNVTNFARIDVDGYSAGCAGNYTSDKYLVGGVRLAEAKSLTINGGRLEFGNGSTNSGSTADRLDVYENLTISNTAGGNLDMDAGTSAQDGTINLQGNFVNNLAASLDEGNGTFRFNGTTEQTIENTAATNEGFYNITTDKTAADLKLLDNITVANSVTLTLGDINLNNFNIELGNTGSISEFLADAGSRRIKDLTATTEANPGGFIRATNRTITTTPTNIAGLGIFLNGTTGTYDVTIRRYHYRAAGGLSIRRGYDVSLVSGTVTSTTLGINYAGEELAGYPETFLTTYRWTLTPRTWFQYLTGLSRSPSTNIVSANAITGFSYWTLAPENVLLHSQQLNLKATSQANNTALLSWTANNFIPHSKIIIEKSLDGNNFIVVAIADNFKNNQFIDNTLSDKAYYRVRYIDADNNSVYSNIAYLTKPISEVIDLTIYPNPFTEKINIQCQALATNQDNITIILYDVVGNALGIFEGKLNTVEQELNLKLSELARGTYLLNCLYATQPAKSYKIIKQ